MRILLLMLLLLAAGIAACNNRSQSSDSGKPVKAADTVKTNLGKENTAELMNVLAAYYSLKDALVASDSNKANASASKLVSATEAFGHNIGGKPEYTEMQPQLERITKAGDSILFLKSSALEMQRTHFSTISDAMFKVLKISGLKNGGVYQQHCPMAFDNKGADWLSSESEIKNPYFGQKMLVCGDVKDSL